MRCARPNNVDKLLYRSGDRVQLDAVSWQLETDIFKAESGEPLSDHMPLAVRFTWSKRDGSAVLDRQLDAL